MAFQTELSNGITILHGEDFFVSRHGAWPSNKQIDAFSDPIMGDLQKVHSFGVEAVKKYNEQAKEAAKNRFYTNEAQRKETARLSLPILKGIKTHSVAIARAKQELEAVQSKIVGVKLRPESPADELRAQEIRSYIRSLPSLVERGEVLRAAQKAGDAETIAAVIGAPAYLSGVEPKAYDLAKQEVMKEAAGTEIARVEELEAGIALAEKSLTMARNYIFERSDYEGVEEDRLSLEGEDLKKVPDIATELGYSTQYRENMSPKEKAEYINEHGRAAYESLPYSKPSAHQTGEVQLDKFTAMNENGEIVEVDKSGNQVQPA